VVAIGTSLPEVAASVVAAYRGYPGLALGNVVGSNICNVGLILALPGLYYTIRASRETVIRDCGVMLSASALLWFSGIFLGQISSFGGVVFLIGFCLYILFLLKSDTGSVTSAAEGIHKESNLIASVKVVVSLLALLVSSNFLVDSAVTIARELSISENA